LDHLDILFVDDNEDILEQAKVFLKRENKKFRVDTTTSAEDAMKKMKRKDYDIIISDYKMPKINGLEFLTRVRGKEEDIPFIILTGYGGNEINKKVSEHGANHFLIKGMNPKETYSTLADHIEKTIEETQSESKKEKTVTEDPGKKVQINVLFIDQDPKTLEKAKPYLEKEDKRLKIETTTSMKKAKGKIDKKKYNLIVSDFEIAENTATDLLKILREEENNEIPFIVFTKKENKEGAKKALENGGNHVVWKGEETENVYNTLARKIVEIAETKKF